LTAIGLASASIHAAERRAITHEDAWLLPRVGAPAVSPDGKLAVFSVTEPAYANDRQVSDLWLVATDGKSSPRRLTQTRASESGMTWSTDSKRIAFASKREGDEVNQIYILDIAGGGEALRATAISTGARLPKFSPDGRRIAFTSDVPPASRNDASSRKRKRANIKYAPTTASPSAIGTPGCRRIASRTPSCKPSVSTTLAICSPAPR
jgi:Tol biopolymer transport system component